MLRSFRLTRPLGRRGWFSLSRRGPSVGRRFGRVSVDSSGRIGVRLTKRFSLHGRWR